MSTLKVNKLRDTAGSTDAITLDPNGGAVLAGVTTISTARITTGITTSIQVGGGVTISESGIEASGIGITCANINGGAIGGRRRLNINGDMRVAQRATSAATQDGTGNEGYMTLDRWYLLHSSSAGGAATMSQDSDVPTDYSWGKFSKSLKMDVTTADTSIDTNHAITLQYRMEAQDIRNSGWDYTNPNSILSVSFWAKSVKAGTYCVALNSQDASPNLDIIKEYTLVANTWKHVEFDIPGNSSLVIDDNNESGMNFLWALVVGTGRQLAAGSWTARSGEAKYGSSNQVNFYDSTDNNFYLTGVQIEVGKPTVFEHHTFAEELSLCQRYYYLHLPADSNGKSFMNSNQYSSNASYGHLQFACTMRTSPTLEIASGTNYYGVFGNATAQYINDLSTVQTNPNGAELGGSTSMGQGNSVWWRAHNASSKIAFTAEL